MTDLGILPGDTYSLATGVNSAGMVVGESVYMDYRELEIHPFFYQYGIMTPLKNLLPQESGWELRQVTGINDAGQIVGWGRNPSGAEHGFVLTPDQSSARQRRLTSRAVVLLPIDQATAARRDGLVPRATSAALGVPAVTENDPGNAAGALPATLSDDGWFELVHSRLVPAWATEWLM